jgi:hypothetical protein
VATGQTRETLAREAAAGSIAEQVAEQRLGQRAVRSA